MWALVRAGWPLQRNVARAREGDTRPRSPCSVAHIPGFGGGLWSPVDDRIALQWCCCTDNRREWATLSTRLTCACAVFVPLCWFAAAGAAAPQVDAAIRWCVPYAPPARGIAPRVLTVHAPAPSACFCQVVTQAHVPAGADRRRGACGVRLRPGAVLAGPWRHSAACSGIWSQHACGVWLTATCTLLVCSC